MSQNHRDEEASPLLAGANQQQENCDNKWRRFKREYRVHFGAGWITTIIVTALITYLVNAKKELPPDICISDRERSSAIILSVFFGSLGKYCNIIYIFLRLFLCLRKYKYRC